MTRTTLNNLLVTRERERERERDGLDMERERERQREREREETRKTLSIKTIIYYQCFNIFL